MRLSASFRRSATSAGTAPAFFSDRSSAIASMRPSKSEVLRRLINWSKDWLSKGAWSAEAFGLSRTVLTTRKPRSEEAVTG